MAQLLDSVKQGVVEAKVWRSAFKFMAVVAFALLAGLLWFVAHPSIVLLPQGVAEATGPMKVTVGKATDPQYLTEVALSDLGLLLDWTPDTVTTQYARFLNRVTPALFASKQVSLVAEAQKHQKAAETEAFFPKTTTVQGLTVSVVGELDQWIASNQVVHQDTTYVVTYQFEGGMLHVASVTTR